MKYLIITVTLSAIVGLGIAHAAPITEPVAIYSKVEDVPGRPGLKAACFIANNGISCFQIQPVATATRTSVTGSPDGLMR